MKKLLTLLTTLLLLFAFSPRVMASKKVYLLTDNTVTTEKKGNTKITGNWGEKAGTPTAPNEDLLLSQVGSTEEYCITLTSTTKSQIYFAFQINNDDNSKRILKPNRADVELTVNDANKKDTQEDGGKAWKVNFTNAYSQIVIHVNLNENKLWVTGTAAVIAPSYYLVGQLLNNSWSDKNEDGYKLTTTDNKIYSCTVDNDKADNYEFRFRIGTNDNTKAKAYHPKDGTVETIGDHKNGYKLKLTTEAGMEQSESNNYWYATLEARHSYTFIFDAENETIKYKDKGDDGLGKAKNYELVVSYGTTTKVLPFSESRFRKERNPAMPYSTDLSTVGFKDEWLPGKKDDKIRIYARKKDDHSYTLNPAVDGSTFGAELQPTDAKFSSIKSYKSESFVTGHPENAYIITKGSGVSYTVALNLGGEIKTTSGKNNNISHYVKGKSLSLYVNESMSEVYKAHSPSYYNAETEDFYLIGALTGKDYIKDIDATDPAKKAQKMERKVYTNPITNKTDSVVYTSVIRWDGNTSSNLWFAFAPAYLYKNTGLTWTPTNPYDANSRWNYIARAQVQDEYDATAQYGCMNLSGTKGDVLCNGEQALNPKVKDEYKYYMVRFNVTTSTYRLIFYKENPVIIKRSKNKFIRTYCSNASWDLPTNGKVKAYVVHSYDKEGEGGLKSQGVMKLREIKYIPAEMGVVLIADGTEETADKIEVNLVSKWDGFATKQEDLWVKTYSDTFNNYLVGLSTDGMFVSEGDFDETENKYVNRNFALNWFSNTKTGKALKAAGTPGLEDQTNGDAGDKDYLGFFRLKGNIQKEYAYLQLSKDVVDYNLQLTGSKEDVQVEDVKLSPNFGMVFDTDFDFVTGINSVSDVKKNSNNGCYTLQGVKVQRPTAPGLYIMNGKKVIVK